MSLKVNDTVPFIRDCRPFQTNSLAGLHVAGVYVLCSYGVTIAATDGQTWWVTTRKYSVSTGRHRNLILRSWQGRTVIESDEPNPIGALMKTFLNP
jgi:hypothetical protein